MTRRYIVTPWLLFLPLFLYVGWELLEYHCFPDPRVLERRQQYWRRASIRGSRGVIQDVRGNILALSTAAASFFVDPQEWSASDAWMLRGIVPDAVVERVSAPMEGRYVRLLRKTDRETAQRLKSLNLKGVHEENEKKREYPNGPLLSHVLGFCDVDDNGQSGIERAWDFVLYEPQDYKMMIRRAGGSQITVGDEGVYDRYLDVAAVTLTVDIRIQYIVEKYLGEAAEANGAKWAAALCLDPNDGAVLASASWPTFDPNSRSDMGRPENIRNNAFGMAYEPGSTFKPIFMGVALESGLVRKNESFVCPGRLKIADGYVSEAENKAMGTISTPELLIKSSNVGMAQIGIRAVPSDMYRALRDWGFGKQSDIEIGGTEKGLIASPGQWRGVVPANIAIGQGLAVTPLQLITASAAIVNGGRLLSPYIVKEAVNSNGTAVYKGRRTVLREVLTPDTCEWLRWTMRETVLRGTGTRAATPVTEMAVKTGTAQVPEKGKYAEGRYVASIVGFWPYANPKYLVLLVIGEPSKGRYYGGELAAPALKKIVEGMADIL
jgi:cell division protein FtsI (penicillin-binding protein 3)/stage V sporulation protein D (sporulation-specific penicillin-binding protein)